MDVSELELRRVREERDIQRASLTFWRTVSAALLMFLLGNGLSYIVFGLKTASKDDLDRIVDHQNTEIQRIRTDVQTLNRTVQEQTGELRARHIISGVTE